MKCIILAANFGARTYPITTDINKSLLPVRGKPVISHIINKVQALDKIDKTFIISNKRFFEQFNEWQSNYPSITPIKIINDGSSNCKDSLGAVKSLLFAIDSEKIDDDLLVIGGDNLFSFSLEEFVEKGINVKPSSLIGVYSPDGQLKPKRFGLVILNKQGKVIDFHEKPPLINGSCLVSLCIYIFPKETLHSIKEYLDIYSNNGSIGNYIKWLVKQRKVDAFNFDGDWFDVSDVDSYTEAVCSF